MEWTAELDNCNTPYDEYKVLNKRARQSAEERKEYESKHEFIRIPITNGFVMVEKEKYLKNKTRYEKII